MTPWLRHRAHFGIRAAAAVAIDNPYNVPVDLLVLCGFLGRLAVSIGTAEVVVVDVVAIVVGVSQCGLDMVCEAATQFTFYVSTVNDTDVDEISNSQNDSRTAQQQQLLRDAIPSSDQLIQAKWADWRRDDVAASWLCSRFST